MGLGVQALLGSGNQFKVQRTSCLVCSPCASPDARTPSQFIRPLPKTNSIRPLRPFCTWDTLDADLREVDHEDGVKPSRLGRRAQQSVLLVCLATSAMEYAMMSEPVRHNSHTDQPAEQREIERDRERERERES